MCITQYSNDVSPILLNDVKAVDVKREYIGIFMCCSLTPAQ
jgi:hypothetical protein